MFFCATSVHWKSDFQLHDTSFLELCAPRFLLFYIICFLFFQMSMRSLMNLILVFLEMMLADFLLFTCLLNKLSELSRRMSRAMVDGSRDPSIWIILMNVADFAVQDFLETSRKCSNHCSKNSQAWREHCVCTFVVSNRRFGSCENFCFCAWGYSFALLQCCCFRSK